MSKTDPSITGPSVRERERESARERVGRFRIRPSSEHRYSPSQLLTGHEPDISHLKTFGCAVYIPIAPPQRTKMGSQRRMGIYVGYDSPTIIKYLEPTTGDLFKARYADCHFDESEHPTLGEIIISW